jgi:predicted transcriptional regulator of viral defense system
MRDEGTLELVSRGVYRLASEEPLEQPDLATVALRVPRAVVCLISALAYHGLTTEVPHEVWIGLPRGTKTPKLDQPPLRVVRFSAKTFSQGIEVKKMGPAMVRIYSAPKTVADCFRFRNQIGVDVAVEALRLCLERKRAKVADILRYARLWRVEKTMKPYLEALQ